MDCGGSGGSQGLGRRPGGRRMGRPEAERAEPLAAGLASRVSDLGAISLVQETNWRGRLDF